MRKQPQLLRNINFYIFQTGSRSKHPTLESSWKLIVIFFTELPSTLLVIRGEIIKGGRTRVDTTEDAFLAHIFQREREGRNVYINAKEIVAKLNQIILRNELYYILFCESKKMNLLLGSVGKRSICLWKFTSPKSQRQNERNPIISSVSYDRYSWAQLWGFIFRSLPFSRQVAISDNWMKNFESGLLREPAIFYYNDELRMFIIPVGQNQFIPKLYFQLNQFEWLILL